ncbi:hypothetical protein FJU30_03975 [Affinibrenneria salicis]|uniref:Uncharacterized protein n=1 Tax=Affinibrenneria salicis TaxID=2590031 RepID=A0A5J5G7V3_9GAMM|nr:hypothetical protein FJU30_00790 [Affinibrenneria salicis]KAA9003331.1 hypothetical protein FJU30_03975 [Affinibrenneria salicis]
MDSWLSNTLRPLFGLNLLDDNWDILELKAGYFICMEGDIVKKSIAVYSHAYHEADLHILTRDRQVILPTTARGREKKLNYTGISKTRAQTIDFSIGLKTDAAPAGIRVFNPHTYAALPIRGCEQIATRADMQRWLARYAQRLPVDYARKLERLLRMRNPRHKAQPGEIFRVELDLYREGYVLVIGDVRRMRKDGLFCADSIWNSLMTVPLFVRPWRFITHNRIPALQEIIEAPLADYAGSVMDDNFLRGRYEYMGRKMLSEEDILLPIGYGLRTNSGGQRSYQLSWGCGTLSKPESETRLTTGRDYLNNGVYSGVPESWFSDDPAAKAALDLLYNDRVRADALAEFGLAPACSFDEFSRQAGSVTREQYLDYLRQSAK